MPIPYFANSVVKKPLHVVQAQQFRPTTITSVGSKDCGAGVSEFFWAPAASWQVQRADLQFSSAASKGYTISKIVGRGILTGLNDTLWLTDGGDAYAVVIPQGFYKTGLLLAAAIETAANEVFPNPVQVRYVNNKFTITATVGTIGFVYTNSTAAINLTHDRNSTAGPAIGFTADKTWAASIAGDDVPGLGVKLPLKVGSASTATYDSASDIPMDVDFAIGIDVDALQDVVATWAISYQSE